MKKLIAITSLLAAGTLFASAATTYTWTGSVGDGKWETVNNWKVGDNPNGYYPQAQGDTAIVGENAGTITVSNQWGFDAKVIEIHSGSSITSSLTDIGHDGTDSSLTFNLYGGDVTISAANPGLYGTFNFNYGTIKNNGLYSTFSLTASSNIWLDAETFGGMNFTAQIDASTYGAGIQTINDFAIIKGTPKLGSNSQETEIDFDFSNITISGFTLNETATSADDLAIGEYMVYHDSTTGAVNVVFNNVPEPSMFGLLAGLGALALVGARRRRR